LADKGISYRGANGQFVSRPAAIKEATNAQPTVTNPPGKQGVIPVTPLMSAPGPTILSQK
jgi:hypothetical protein